MTECEQLELCAKAAEVYGVYIENSPKQGEIRTGIWDELTERCWNPLTDDGDCARLEAKLGIDVDWRTDWVRASLWTIDLIIKHIQMYREHNNDKQSARRAAVCAVAAEIGRGLNDG